MEEKLEKEKKKKWQKKIWEDWGDGRKIGKETDTKKEREEENLSNCAQPNTSVPWSRTTLEKASPTANANDDSSWTT